MESSIESDDSTMDPSYIGNLSAKSEMELDIVDNFSNESVSMKEFSNISSASKNVNDSSLHIINRTPLIFSGKYFKILKHIGDTDHQKKARGILAACQICSHNKTIKGSLNITSNFLQHLKSKHPKQYEEYLIEKQRRGSIKSRVEEPQTPPTKFSEIDNKFLKFVVDTHSPLSIVEHPSFKELFQNTGIKVCSQTDIKNVLDVRYKSLVINLQEAIRSIPYMCTTANVWLMSKQFFFGYTCHWVSAEFKRKSVALAFHKISASQAANKVSEIIYNNNIKFGLSDEKVVATMTNNGSNFGIAFKELGLNRFQMPVEDDCDSLDSENKIEMGNDLTYFCQTFEDFDKCGNQFLNTLATRDFVALLKLNKNLYSRHLISFNRCSSVWNNYNKLSTVENIQNLLGSPLKTPSVTSWTSVVSSLKHLLQNKNKIDELCSLLDTSKFTLFDIGYLEEYTQLMEPIADAIDFLQQENNMFYGYFLPTLITIKVKLRKLDEYGNLKHLKYMAQQMETALYERFQDYFEIAPECHNAVIAAVSCPPIKMRFVKSLCQTAQHVTYETIESLFISHADALQMEVNPQQTFPEKLDTSSANSFFDFDQGPEVKVKQENEPQSIVRREFKRYMEDDDCDLSSLDWYPIIKRVFLKYNTPLPSYASVERLFSYSGLPSLKKRRNLFDNYFDKFVFLRANNSI